MSASRRRFLLSLAALMGAPAVTALAAAKRQWTPTVTLPIGPDTPAVADPAAPPAPTCACPAHLNATFATDLDAYIRQTVRDEMVNSMRRSF